MPEVTRRWQFVLSKNFWLARNAKLFAAHGALARSRVMVILPWLVSITMSRLPTVGMSLPFGRPVSLRSLSIGFCASPLSDGFGVYVHVVVVAAAGVVVCFLPPLLAFTITTTATMTTATAATAPRMLKFRRRRAWACSWRS